MKKLLLLCLLIAACSDDPTGVECTSRLACDIGGVDLAMLSVRADSLITSWGVADVIDASDIDVEFVVVNRGTETAPASDVVVNAFDMTATVRIPSLAPGDTVVGTAAFTVERAYLYAGAETETRNITAEVVSADAEPGNNLLNSTPYALNLPYVMVEPLIELRQTTSLAAGGRVLVRWNWRQGFMGGVDADRAVAFLVCLRRGTATCTTGSWQALERVEPISFQRISRLVSVTAAGAATPITGDYELLVCTVPRSHTALYVDLSDPDHHCERAGSVTITE